MSNPFGAFTSISQGALGLTLSYYMFTLAPEATDPLQKFVGYNAAAWALVKALSSVMQILICYVLNPSLWADIFNSLFGTNMQVQSALVEQWCKNFENTGMRANYVGTIIAGVSTLIFAAMCDKLDSESHLWAMVLLMRFFDLLYNVAKVGDSKFKTSGVQNMFALWFIAIAMAVFIWSTGVVDATEDHPVSTMNRWFIGLCSAHLFVLLLLITIKSVVYGESTFFGIEKLVKRSIGDGIFVTFEAKFFSAYVEEGLTTLVFSALFAIGSIAFHNEVNKGHMLFVLLMLINADLVSRNPITDAGLDDDDLPGGDRPGSAEIFASTRVIHLVVGVIAALGYMSYDGEKGMLLSLFVWTGVAAGLLKVSAAVIGMFVELPGNIQKDLTRKENEMEVGLRRLSSFGLLVSGAGLFILLEDNDPNEMAGLSVSIWLFIIGIAARLSDLTIDVALPIVGENAVNALVGKGDDSIVMPSSRDPNEVRVPGVMLLCASSLVCLCFAFTDNFEGEHMQENVEKMEDDMQVVFWVLFGLLIVHGAVALMSILAFYVPGLKYIALSTIELVRVIVSTAVLALYTILIAHEWTSGRELLLVGAILYLAVDVIGRNLV